MTTKEMTTKKALSKDQDNNGSSSGVTKQAKIAGVVLIATLLISTLLAAFNGTLTQFTGANVLIRTVTGLLLGYVLIRSYFGFAGSVNRAMRGNSMKLMRAVMFCFGISAVFTGLLMAAGYTSAWNNPINGGLVVGAILFGAGMAFASACASGCLTDGVWNPTKMVIVVTAFGVGVLLGFPLQTGTAFVKEGATFNFNTDIVDGKWLGAVIGICITIILCVTVIGLTKIIDVINNRKGKDQGKFDEYDFSYEWTFNELNKKYTGTYQKMIERPFTLFEGAIALSIAFLVLILLTGDLWGASTPFGAWVGQFLNVTNIVTPEQLANFTGKPAGLFGGTFLSVSVGIQNIAIFIGGVIAALSMNKYAPTFKVNLKEAILWTIGGLLMGVGTRLANGCNVGALYSPIASGSSAGWLFLIFMILGAIGGNVIFKYANKSA